LDTDINPPLITKSFTEPSEDLIETVPSAKTPSSGA
jgi:hypothetical protein